MSHVYTGNFCGLFPNSGGRKKGRGGSNNAISISKGSGIVKYLRLLAGLPGNGERRCLNMKVANKPGFQKRTHLLANVDGQEFLWEGILLRLQIHRDHLVEHQQ